MHLAEKLARGHPLSECIIADLPKKEKTPAAPPDYGDMDEY